MYLLSAFDVVNVDDVDPEESRDVLEALHDGVTRELLARESVPLPDGRAVAFPVLSMNVVVET